MFNELIEYFTSQGASYGVALTYIIVSILIVIMAIAALVMRIMVFVKYQQGNHMQTQGGKTCVQVAREILDKAGLNDVQVKKAGIFRAFFIGNSYSIKKKTIYLRGGIMDKNSITAVGLALQKVGIAKMCAEGNKMVGVRNVALILGFVGPFLFVPVVLIGFLIDIFLFNTLGTFSIIGIIVGMLIISAGFVATLLNLPVEKKANNIALQIIEQTGVLTEEETAVIKKVFQAYIIAYVCEFIVAVLRVIQLVLEIVMRAQINKK